MISGSKKLLLDLIKRKGTLSMDKAVEHVDLAKTTIREHLLQLERDGYVEREYVRAGPGRPSLHYQLTSKGNSLFPSYESALIREMISYLKSQGKEETIKHFFETFWDDRLARARKKLGEAPESKQDVRAQISILMEMLEKEGFMPEFQVDEETDTLTVKECNCPFREVVKETRLPCKLEELFYKKLFNTDAERTTYIPDGDYSCTYDIPI